MTYATLVLALLATSANATSNDPVILDFHASWCGPCQQMRPAVELLVEKGYPVKSVDIDRAQSLATRYKVTSVPTFVVVDAGGKELGRTQGLQPASQLASLYREARAKVQPASASGRPQAVAVADDEEPAHPDASESDADEPAPTKMPLPWETVVRIRVHSGATIGFGSGTVIQSTPQESIILTCAHIFKIEGARSQPPPSRFPYRITVDLFDGKLQGRHPAMVHRAATVAGEVIDYDFTGDVGLIRIRPGHRLPASKVVPPHWKPLPRMEMTTVGCSEGNDATAWTTWIVNPTAALNVGGRRYDAIECVHAPKQGRSGGGLYTSNGYLAGVCDFAEPVGNRGLYAAPQSIYKLLDRNRLTLVYNPKAAGSGNLMAQNRPAPRPPAPARTVRAQSPDRAETKQVTMPSPELLGITQPAASGQPDRSRKTAWKASGSAPGAIAQTRTASSLREEPAIPVEIDMPQSVDDDGLDAAAPVTERSTAPAPAPSTTRQAGSGHWRAVRSADGY